jgi:type IV secretion system protein VirB9
MKLTSILCSLAIAAFCGVALHGQGAAKRPTEKARPLPPPPPPAPSVVAAPTPAADSEPVARIIQYSEKDVVKLKAMLRYTTLIVLPKTEKILDFVCGDKEFWVVNGAENMAYIKPAKMGAQTDLNLITAGGNIYSFVLVEVSEMPDAMPDLKVFIEPKDESMVSAANSSPRFVRAQEVDDFRQQAEIAKQEIRRMKQEENDQIDHGINRALNAMRFSYVFRALRKPFNVLAMYHDDKFTYVQARPEEPPVIYEVRDGIPNLIEYEFSKGLYVIHKILDDGYFEIGKAKLHFARKD